MRMEILIAIATPILAFAGAILGHWISAHSSRKERKHQLAMAALEKRLAVHQQAFNRWISIFHNIHDHNEELFQIVVDAQDWFYKNCLYLDDTARNDFWNCLIQAPLYKDLLESSKEIARGQGGIRDEKTERMVKESWNTILRPGESIPAGVELPPFGSSEPPLDKNS